MISRIAYYQIAGLPLVAYLGALTLFFLIFTALVGYLNFKGNTRIPFKWHPRLAAATIIFAIVHAIFALSAHLGF
jgi:cytochrome b561